MNEFAVYPWVIRSLSSQHSSKLDYYRFLNQLARDADMTSKLTLLYPEREDINSAAFALDCALCAELHYNEESIRESTMNTKEYAAMVDDEEGFRDLTSSPLETQEDHTYSVAYDELVDDAVAEGYNVDQASDYAEWVLS